MTMLSPREIHKLSQGGQGVLQFPMITVMSPL